MLATTVLRLCKYMFLRNLSNREEKDIYSMTEEREHMLPFNGELFISVSGHQIHCSGSSRLS